MSNLTFEKNYYRTPAGLMCRKPSKVDDLRLGFVLLSADNEKFIALGGRYARAAVEHALSDGEFSLSRLRVAALSLIGGTYSTKSNDGTKRIMPVRIPRFSNASDDASFVRVMNSFCEADGFLHNIDGKLTGMFSTEIENSTYPAALSLVPKILNEYPQHKDAGPYIAKAAEWAKAHANSFRRKIAVRWYVWISGERLYSNSVAVGVSNEKRALWYPYADLQVGDKFVSLPVWWPQNFSMQAAAGNWGRAKNQEVKDPFYTYGSSRGSNFEWAATPVVDPDGADFENIGNMKALLGGLWPTAIDQVYHNKPFGGNPAVTIAKQGYEAFQVIEDGEVTWELQANARNNQVAALQNDESYKTRGCIKGAMPDQVTGGSQYALLYGMSSAISTWKNGSQIECAALMAPIDGDHSRVAFSSSYEFLFGPREDLYD